MAAIGLSRIYLGVHYPSDVIAGYLAAALWVSTLLALDRVRIERKSAPGPVLSWFGFLEKTLWIRTRTVEQMSPLVRQPVEACGGLV